MGLAVFEGANTGTGAGAAAIDPGYGQRTDSREVAPLARAGAYVSFAGMFLGTLGVILSNAAAGACIAGLVGALVGAGIPEDEAKYYHGEFEAGRTIVTVSAGSRYDEAAAILRRFGAYDMSTRGTAAGRT